MRSVIWILSIALVIVSAGYIYKIVNPSPNVVKIKYIPGDTVKTIEFQEVFDTVYIYKYIAKIDTIKTIDTVYLSYWSKFKLGTDTLGVRGRVDFDMKDFSFSDIVFNNIKVTNTITDTLKFTNEYVKPFYLNEWFYTTIALLIAFIGGSL